MMIFHLTSLVVNSTSLDNIGLRAPFVFLSSAASWVGMLMRYEYKQELMCAVFSPSCVSVPEDLSLEERDELSNIRRRKRELLDDIEVCVWPNEHLMVVLLFLVDIMHCADSRKNNEKKVLKIFLYMVYSFHNVWSLVIIFSSLPIYLHCCAICMLASMQIELKNIFAHSKKKGWSFHLVWCVCCPVHAVHHLSCFNWLWRVSHFLLRGWNLR